MLPCSSPVLDDILHYLTSFSDHWPVFTEVQMSVGIMNTIGELKWMPHFMIVMSVMVNIFRNKWAEQQLIQQWSTIYWTQRRLRPGADDIKIRPDTSMVSYFGPGLHDMVELRTNINTTIMSRKECFVLERDKFKSLTCIFAVWWSI